MKSLSSMGLQLFVTNIKDSDRMKQAIDVPSTSTIGDLTKRIKQFLDTNDKDLIIRVKLPGGDWLDNNALLSNLGICAESYLEFQIIEPYVKLSITMYDQYDNFVSCNISKIRYVVDPLSNWDKEASNHYHSGNYLKKRMLQQQYGAGWTFYDELYDVLNQDMDWSYLDEPYGVSRQFILRLDAIDSRHCHIVIDARANTPSRLILLDPNMVDEDAVLQLTVRQRYGIVDLMMPSGLYYTVERNFKSDRATA